MAFTYDTSTEVGRARFYMRDTSQPEMYTDEEIEFGIDEAGSVNTAVILLLELKLLDLANPDYRADWLGESQHAAAAKTLRGVLDDLRDRFGLPGVTATVTHVYRADSKQTEAPDYSEGV